MEEPAQQLHPFHIGHLASALPCQGEQRSLFRRESSKDALVLLCPQEIAGLMGYHFNSRFFALVQLLTLEFLPIVTFEI